jgi:hypothetical protein
VFGAHAGLTGDVPLPNLPFAIRGGLALDLDHGYRLGRNPAHVTAGAVVASIGVARAY